MDTPLLKPVRDPRPGGLSPLTALGDVGLVAAQATLVVLVSRPNTPWDSVPGTWDSLIGQSTITWLSLGAGAAAFAAAALCGVARRLGEDSRMVWVGAALGVYGVVGIPVTGLGAGADPDLPDGAVVPFIGHVVVALALVASVQPWARRTTVSGGTAFGVGITGVLVMLGLAFLWPAAAVELTKYLPLRLSVALAWLMAALAIVWRSISVGERARLWLGLGLLLVATSHGYWLCFVELLPTDRPELAFHAVRLLGVLLALLGASMQVWRLPQLLAAERQRERLRLIEAETGLARLIERDHELRNGIAGLAGVATALDRSEDESRRQAVRSAIAAELSRLDILLADTSAGSADCEPAEVVDRIAALWRANGLDIRCDVPVGLTVHVPPGVVSQIVVNLLSNCARHAPGSPVRVRAEEVADRVLLSVADSGPGVPRGVDVDPFARGAKGSGSAGRGLGLYLCRKLLAEHGAGIDLAQGVPGCLVLVDMPAAGGGVPTAETLDVTTAARRLGAHRLPSL